MLVQVDLSMQPVMIQKSGPPKEMLSVTRLADGRTKVRINSSSLAIMQECWRKAHLTLDQGWKSKVESPATIFGSAIHKALEVFYSTDARPAMTQLTHDQLELIAHGQDVPTEGNLLLEAAKAFVAKAQPLKMLPAQDKRSIQTGVWLLSNYFDTYFDDPLTVLRDEKGEPFVERGVSLIISEDDRMVIEYFGTIDLILKNMNTGALFVTDHKTSSIIGNDFYNRLKPNHQYTGYLLMANKVLGVETDSFLVNCLQVKERPKTSRGQGPHFVRQITQRDDNDYAEFIDAVRSFAWDYIEYRASNVWPMGHVNACASYAGCQFLSVCSAPKQLRESVLSSKFMQQGV